MGGKLGRMAEGMQTKIDNLRRDRLSNTPKRQCEAMSARCEAANLERIQRALQALANGWDTGSIPHAYQHLKTKAALEPITRKIVNHPSYYVVCESDKYQDESPFATEFRAWVAAATKGAHAGVDAERERAESIKRAEEQIRFNPIPGFFPTPPDLISFMLELANIRPGDIVLEPSAGKGDLADAAKAAGASVDCWEINYQLTELCKLKGHNCMHGDFMAEVVVPEYDKILMNPPFEKGQDMLHVTRAYEWLKDGGTLVAIVSASVTMDKGAAFRNWLDQVGGILTRNDDNAFKGAFRSTSVSTYTVSITK